MPVIPFAQSAVELAKEERLHLVILHINGRHAERGSATFNGPMGPEMTQKVWDLFNELCDVEKRMR